jgi:RND family efflux transporter MFP subunit
MAVHSLWSRWSGRGWRILSVLVGVLLLLGALAWMSGVLRHKVKPGTVEVQRPTAEGRTLVPVESLTTTETIDAVGTVEPRRKANVASQILALVRTVTVRASDQVSQSQLLIELDDRDVQAQLREAEAALAGAQADLDVRQRDYQRYQQMVREKAVTKEDFDRVEGAYKAALAQVKRLQEQVGRIRNVMLSYTKIEAQAAGIIGDRYVDPGDLAVPGKPLLSLYDPKERELHANVPENLAFAVQVNLKLPVRVDAARYVGEGVVREIVPQAQPTSRSFLVKVSLPPEAARVVSVGMFGRLSIPVKQVKSIVIPAAAVIEVGQEDMVDVVGKDNVLQRRFVRIGRPYGEHVDHQVPGEAKTFPHGKLVEVLSGLKVGEEVALPKQ